MTAYIPPGAVRAAGGKMVAYKPDNGLVHYGAGLRSAFCSVEDPAHQTQGTWTGVTCPECKSLQRRAR